MANILLFDEETAPILGYTWKLWDTSIIEVVRDTYLLSFAWKWYNKKKTDVLALPDFPLYKKEPHNDRDLTKKLWELFDEADIVIGHNANKFDVKVANARFMHHNIRPPTPYKTVDTLREFKKYTNRSSFKLDFLSKQSTGQGKVRVDKQVWLGCLNGDLKEWSKMKVYNKRDVTLLEDRYKEILPWITNHPNLNVIDDTRDKCPNCNGFLSKRGRYITRTGKYQRYQCVECGAWSHSVNDIIR